MRMICSGLIRGIIFFALVCAVTIFSPLNVMGQSAVEYLRGTVHIKEVLASGFLLKNGTYKVCEVGSRTIIFGPEHVLYVIDGVEVEAHVSQQLPEKWDKPVAEHYPNASYVVRLIRSKIRTRDATGKDIEVQLFPDEPKVRKQR